MRKDFEFEDYLIFLPSYVSRESTVTAALLMESAVLL